MDELRIFTFMMGIAALIAQLVMLYYINKKED